jgi:hypothetical protein
MRAGCAWVSNTHICPLKGSFCQVGKKWQTRYQTIGVSFFSYFAKFLRMVTSFDKLLEMLSTRNGDYLPNWPCGWATVAEH